MLLTLAVWSHAADRPDLDAMRAPHRLSRTGAIAAGVGLGVGAVFPLTALAVCAADDAGRCLGYVFVVGIPVELGAAALTLTGEGLMFGGGIAAARRGGRSPALGWAGLALVGAGTVAVVTAAPGTNDYDVPLAIGGVGAAATGTVLGLVQVGRNGQLLREPLALVPTLNGAALVGRF